MSQVMKSISIRLEEAGILTYVTTKTETPLG